MMAAANDIPNPRLTPEPEAPTDQTDVQRKLQSSLFDMERTGGVVGWCASKLLSAGDWIERELEERRQTIGGIDNLFLLLADALDFNPVSPSYYQIQRVFSLEQLQPRYAHACLQWAADCRLRISRTSVHTLFAL